MCRERVHTTFKYTFHMIYSTVFTFSTINVENAVDICICKGYYFMFDHCSMAAYKIVPLYIICQITRRLIIYYLLCIVCTMHHVSQLATCCNYFFLYISSSLFEYRVREKFHNCILIHFFFYYLIFRCLSVAIYDVKDYLKEKGLIVLDGHV